MRRRNVKHAHERILEQVEIGLIITEPSKYKGCWHQLFNNDNPIYIEIGMGKGQFICELARRNLNINYLGMEKFESVLIQAPKKIKEGEVLNNLHFILADASDILNMFEEDEISKIYLNFSDPWPKHRHEKRRLTSKDFLDKYQKISKGEIEFKTDNRGLFEYSLISLNENHYTFLDLSLDLHNDPQKMQEGIVTTEYEDRFSSMGNPIYFIKVIKK